MADAPEPVAHERPADGLSSDAWFGGRLTLLQPKGGHRVGSDAALLAAAAAPTDGRVVDVGAGVGAVGLALAKRHERLAADLVEIDPRLARLAADNAATNGLAERVRGLEIDIRDARARREAGLADDAAEAVVTNPPFFDAREVRTSPDAARARAHVFSADAADVAPLIGWIRASLAILKPGGRFDNDPSAGGARHDPRGRGEQDRRACASARVPSPGRVRPSPSRFGRQRVEGAAPHRAGARSPSG